MHIKTPKSIKKILSQGREKQINKVDSKTSEYVLLNVDGNVEGEHRLIWENNHGKIPNGFLIHHINEDKKDNRLENLKCVSRRQHAIIHRVGFSKS